MRFELTTSTLARLRSTPELRPRSVVLHLMPAKGWRKTGGRLYAQSNTRLQPKIRGKCRGNQRPSHFWAAVCDNTGEKTVLRPGAKGCRSGLGTQHEHRLGVGTDVAYIVPRNGAVTRMDEMVFGHWRTGERRGGRQPRNRGLAEYLSAGRARRLPGGAGSRRFLGHPGVARAASLARRSRRS